MENIAVTLSVYGNFDLNRLHATILSVKSQLGVNLEIIVSEQNLASTFGGVASKLGVKYVFSEPELKGGVSCYNPGRIRNMALSRITSELAYLNDSDILFSNPSFLSDLAGYKTKSSVLIKPPMRRLLIDYVDDFVSSAFKKEILNELNNLYHPNDFVATSFPAEVDLKVVNHKGRVYTISMEKFLEYKADDSLKGLEPTIWHDTVHCGGIFSETEKIFSVGGYCEQFWTWGYEDRDLQWKLGEIFECQEIPRLPKFEVIHLFISFFVHFY